MLNKGVFDVIIGCISTGKEVRDVPRAFISLFFLSILWFRFYDGNMVWIIDYVILRQHIQVYRQA